MGYTLENAPTFSVPLYMVGGAWKNVHDTRGHPQKTMVHGTIVLHRPLSQPSLTDHFCFSFLGLAECHRTPPEVPTQPSDAILHKSGGVNNSTSEVDTRSCVSVFVPDVAFPTHPERSWTHPVTCATANNTIPDGSSRSTHFTTKQRRI